MATCSSDLDFDVLEFCRKLRTSKQPPYTCPIVECGKTYKSMCGLQYHLVIFDHNTMKKVENGSMTPGTPAPTTTPHTWSRKSKKKRRLTKVKQSTPKPVQVASPKERRPCADTQNIMEFEIDNEVIRVSIDENIPMISKHNYEVKHGALVNFTMELPKSKDLMKLPEPQFALIDDYSLSGMPDKPIGYIRFIEKSAEDLDGEVEYDMDEEDSAWLDLINNIRQEQSLSPVTVDVFELLMDRLEKESYFQMKTNSQSEGPAMIDDDAICCICMDGECQNSNVILFCDMCNLAVHQDCYGVPYIPEGQWLCRRCLQSPSRAVDCVLCPNNGGAFKQTDRGHWAHVVCALWIPEVRFANTVFLEPIDSIETIPPARWKLTCYLCKQRGVGACIQCHKTNCYSAFHVTCAQAAGLYMKIDAVKDTNPDNKGREIVEKIAFCDTHCPPNAEERPKLNVNDTAQKHQMNKSSTAPVISIPTIPPEKIQEIGSLVSIAKKSQFVQRLIAYWTLKRQLRNGVPLLRRLQTTHMNKKGESQTAANRSDDLTELGKQLKYWQHLRQDLERARLLCELVRKREKLKRELTKVKAASLEMELVPFKCYLHRLLDLIRAKDTGEIFIEPVDQTEVPDYSDIVKNPMDLSTMRTKIDQFEYENFKDFKADFTLMINNCLAYNSKETAFYRAAIKMRDQCASLFKQAEKDLEAQGLAPRESESQSDALGEIEEDFGKPDLDISDFDVQLVNLTNNDHNMNGEETMEKLNQLLDMTKGIRHGQARTKRVKLIKTLIAKIKRSRTKKKGKSEEDVTDEEKSAKSKKKSESGTPVSKEGHVTSGKKTPATKTSNSSISPASRRRGRGGKSEDVEVMNKNADSFRMYRSTETNVKSDEEEEGSDEGSSCSECSSGSRSGSSCDSSGEWTDSDQASVATDVTKEKLEQLQLVWAKCRGYPWYPALIINPKMPRGYIHNGVPIPSPPADVIALANNYTEPVYLVLFFDTKRTWQWLPRNKLEPLGVNEELDEMKLVLSRKPADRKAVRKAYQEAMQHRTQIDKPTSPQPK